MKRIINILGPTLVASATLAVASAGAFAATPLSIIPGYGYGYRPADAPIGSTAELTHVHWTKWTTSEAVGTGTFTCDQAAMGSVCPPAGVKRGTVTYFAPSMVQGECGSRPWFSRETVVGVPSGVRWSASSMVWVVGPGNCRWNGLTDTPLSATRPIKARPASLAERRALAAYASNQGQPVPYSRIRANIAGNWALVLAPYGIALVQHGSHGWGPTAVTLPDLPAPCTVPANAFLALRLATYTQQQCR